MDKSDQLTDLEAQIAREQASLLQLHIMKETLQSEVVAKQEELERVQGLKRKQEKHRPSKKKQKTGQITNTHCASISNNIFHDTDMASKSISTRDNIFVDETCVNAQKEHLVMAKSAPLPATRNLMGEFDGVKIAKKNVKQNKETLHKEGEQHEDEREQLHNTNCTIVSHNINHDINITASSTSNIHSIQLDETHVDTETEDSLSSNEEVEAQVQTKKNTRR